jgi:hypothetical protein
MLRMRGADGVDREGQGSSDPWGLFDMIGTIVQSCWDILDPGVYGSYRVLRGMRARAGDRVGERGLRRTGA